MNLDAQVAVSVGRFRLDVALAVEAGSLVAVLGPNGAGKSTLLRAIAGLLPIDAGRIALGNAVFDDPVGGVFVPAESRPVGVVFQDHLLFPHLSALDNIAFGPRRRGVHRNQARRNASDWLDRLGLADKADARPRQLSGGQAQRVALARALATNPAVLLLDEPLAALDAQTRAEVRRDLRRHLDGFDGVRLLVTHDPLDAFALADRLVIVEGGRIIQSGTADEISGHPRSDYAAGLVGTNLYRGTARRGSVQIESGATVMTTAGGVSGDVFVVISPAAVALHRQPPEGSPRNTWSGRVASIDWLGDRTRVRVDGPLDVAADITAAAIVDLGLRAGEPIWVAVKASEVAVFPA